MKTTRFALSTLVAAGATFFFESSGMPLLSRVDWFLLAVAYQAAGGDFAAATLGGAGGGLIQDLLLHPLRGANAFSKALFGYLFTLISVRVVFAGALVVAVTLALAALVNSVIIASLGTLLLSTRFLVSGEDFGNAVVTGSVGGLLYTAWRFPWKEEWRKRRRRRLH